MLQLHGRGKIPAAPAPCRTRRPVALAVSASLPEDGARKKAMKAKALELNRMLEEFPYEQSTKDMHSLPSTDFRASLTFDLIAADKLS